jgi:hypothetical protein
MSSPARNRCEHQVGTASNGGFHLKKERPVGTGPSKADGTAGAEPRPIGGAPDGAARPRPRPNTILQGDRRKAFRPIPPEDRRAALEDGLAAYARGDFFRAHELLEPAWMGTADLAERALYQGIIKLAAGYVHAVRGNPLGLARNLEGARRHLATSLELDPGNAAAAGIDLGRLIGEVDLRLAAVRAIMAGGEAADLRAPMLDLADGAPGIRPE